MRRDTRCREILARRHMEIEVLRLHRCNILRKIIQKLPKGCKIMVSRIKNVENLLTLLLDLSDKIFVRDSNTIFFAEALEDNVEVFHFISIILTPR